MNKKEKKKNKVFNLFFNNKVEDECNVYNYKAR